MTGEGIEKRAPGAWVCDSPLIVKGVITKRGPPPRKRAWVQPPKEDFHGQRDPFLLDPLPESFFAKRKAAEI